MMIDIIEENFEHKNDRELAKDLDISEPQIESIRKEEGFLRLSEFEESDQKPTKLDIEWELDKMEKRKLQGYLGEKVTKIISGKVKNHLKGYTRQNWVLKDKIHLINSSKTFQRYWANRKPVQGNIKLEGRHLKHDGQTSEDLKEHVKERSILVDEDLFKKFKELRNPFIDFNFYALRENGSETVEFETTNYGDSADAIIDEKISVDIPVIDDFKIIMLEVKTSSRKINGLLTKNQREAKRLAEGSPYLEFFTIKIDKSFEDLQIPTDYRAKLEKHT